MQKKRVDGIGAIIVAGLMVIVASASYPLYHAVMECLFLVAAALIYIFTTLTHHFHRSSFLRIVGVGFLSAALLTFLHLITQNGLGFSSGFHHANFYELAAIMMMVSAVFLASIFFHGNQGYAWAGWTLAALQVSLLFAILWQRVPLEFFRNEKILSRCGLILLGVQALGAVILWMRRKAFHPWIYRCVHVMSFFFTVNIISLDYPDRLLWGLAGHAAKVGGAFIFIYGVVYLGIKSPLQQFFSELKSNAVCDPLTGLYNRHGFHEMASKVMHVADVKRIPLGLLVMDLDNFKGVNDHFGHMMGDDILKNFGNILRGSVGSKGVPFRTGGDEFLVIVKEGTPENMAAVEERIRRAFNQWVGNHVVAGVLGLSIGTAIRRPGQGNDLDQLIHEADVNMYREKRGNPRKGLLRNAR